MLCSPKFTEFGALEVLFIFVRSQTDSYPHKKKNPHQGIYLNLTLVNKYRGSPREKFLINAVNFLTPFKCPN